ncbi:hypothetical protein [Rhodomicrobium sp. Az07]|uniref:hypothetical protein n=1 Tax=Rhodomicrobium sp. Az07 TaxID=2839034 RepID=UPI0035302142
MLDGATNWQEVHRRFVSKKLTIKQRGAGLSIEDETRRSIRASAVDRLWHRITREAVRPVPGRCLDHRPLTLQEAQAFAQVMRGAGLHDASSSRPSSPHATTWAKEHQRLKGPNMAVATGASR